MAPRQWQGAVRHQGRSRPKAKHCRHQSQGRRAPHQILRRLVEEVPTFGQPTAIYLGADAPLANPVTLTCHDWIADGSTPWNQRHIRNAEKRPSNTGFWAVDVKRAGEYTVELRRWPKEADAAITASMKAGADVPGVTPFRAVDGKPFAAAKAHLVGRPRTYPAGEAQRQERHLQAQAQARPRRVMGQVHRRRRHPHGRILCVCDKTKVSLSAGAHAVCKPQWDNLKIIIYRSS